MRFFPGVVLVAQQDLRIRLRTGRWQWMLGAWVIVVGLFTGLLEAADESTHQKGVALFGALMLLVLSLAMLVSPALTAQSINGDRERGTLAPLQVTALTPAQIALGKLLAGWSVGLTALGLTLPFVGWCMIRGGIGPVRVVVVLTVVGLLIGVVCAVSQALSAVLARSITSALVSYLAVFALVVGTLIAFIFSNAITSDTDHDHDWVVLAANPFVVLADAAPRLPPRRFGVSSEPRPYDPLGDFGHELRELRGDPRIAECDERQCSYASGPDAWIDERAIWPYGLGINLAMGAAALYITTVRLRAPSRRLARGVRVA
ncbi:MAG: ABC transporter permease [Dactylosporangium sp.]|nr:ABC transporter permease [Dactylosporangium sp.]